MLNLSNIRMFLCWKCFATRFNTNPSPFLLWSTPFHTPPPTPTPQAKLHDPRKNNLLCRQVNNSDKKIVCVYFPFSSGGLCYLAWFGLFRVCVCVCVCARARARVYVRACMRVRAPKSHAEVHGFFFFVFVFVFVFWEQGGGGGRGGGCVPFSVSFLVYCYDSRSYTVLLIYDDFSLTAMRHIQRWNWGPLAWLQRQEPYQFHLHLGFPFLGFISVILFHRVSAHSLPFFGLFAI